VALQTVPLPVYSPSRARHARTDQTRGRQPVRLWSVVQRRRPPARHHGAIGAALGLQLYRSVPQHKPPPSDAVVIEFDEMWHFLQRKDNKVWIWKA
jgi:hypothetical protein